MIIKMKFWCGLKNRPLCTKRSSTKVTLYFSAYRRHIKKCQKKKKMFIFVPCVVVRSGTQKIETSGSHLPPFILLFPLHKIGRIYERGEILFFYKLSPQPCVCLTEDDQTTRSPKKMNGYGFFFTNTISENNTAPHAHLSFFHDEKRI